MKRSQELYGRIMIKSDSDAYVIVQVDSVEYNHPVFAVTSRRGIDTFENGVVFKTIEKAINYVNKSIREND